MVIGGQEGVEGVTVGSESGEGASPRGVLGGVFRGMSAGLVVVGRELPVLRAAEVGLVGNGGGLVADLAEADAGAALPLGTWEGDDGFHRAAAVGRGLRRVEIRHWSRDGERERNARWFGRRPGVKEWRVVDWIFLCVRV